MKSQKKYKAFTLLEVIIAIIIISIVIVLFPMVFRSTVSANKQINKEEVFFQEFSLLSLINSRYFDENNTVDENFYKDVNATGGDSELFNNYSSKNAGSTSRLGKTQIDNNIFRSGTGMTTSVIGTDSADETQSDTSTLDDIDDFNGYSETVNGNTIDVKVTYMDDSTDYSQNTVVMDFNYSKSASNTNIKLITISCKVGDTNITLRYPTSNIGASKFLSLEEIR